MNFYSKRKGLVKLANALKEINTISEALKSIVGKEYVLTEAHHRALRASTCSPFPLHIWKNHIPDVVVLPGHRDEIVDIVKLANQYKIPVVPRGAASGLADGAVPLKGGIVIDYKRMSEILEIDEQDMCVTVQPGINMLELNRVLSKLGLFYPDDPASYVNSIVGGRIGAGGFSLIGAGYGHVPDLVISMEVVLPTGEVITVGEGGGRKIRKSSVGFRLKDLFIGHQGTLGIVTEATLEMFPRPEAEFPAFFAFEEFNQGYKTLYDLGRTGLKTLSGAVLFDEWKIDYLRRDDEAYIPLPEKIKSVLCTICYGTKAEVDVAKKTIFKVAKAGGGTYLGREISEGDWASRHDRYHIPFHGRRADGQVVRMSWHCEDSAINYSALPEVKKRWHEIVGRYKAKYDGIFDDWGMFMYTNNPYKPWGDYLTEIDIGVNELALTEETWAAWLEMKREIAEVAVEFGGSISSCHGGTRPGDVEVACYQELANGQFALMKKIKKMLDPNNIMNPGKYLLDEAYEGGE
jgi:glycolate oxidase